MHRALHIAEILRNICDEVEDMRTLSDLARCCKATHEPAMQALWYHIPNLVPLIKCFPAGVWTIKDRQIKFARIPCPEEWSTFLRNAKLVRDLGSPNSAHCRMHRNIMETLSGVRPVLVLFPHVRVLSWGHLGLEDRCLPSFLSMVGNLVTTVKIAGWNNDSVSERFLRASIAIASARLHQLRKLSLTFESPDIPLTTNAVKSLADLKTIRVFDFRPPYNTDWSSIRSPQPFASLTELSVCFETKAYVAFSKAAALPHLAVLTLYVDDGLEPELVSEFFTSIRHQCSPASLRRLSILPECDHDATRGEAVVRSADLRPLLDFTRMEHFELSIPCHHAFDDAFLSDLANAFPQLRLLDLATMGAQCAHDVFPSLAGLLSIVVGCRSLDELWLTFDASGEVAEELCSRRVGSGAAAATSGATTLFVGNCPIDGRPHSVALFLALTFPEVTYFDYSEFNASEYLTRWEDVEEYLSMFESVRKDERLRIERGIEASTGTAVACD